MPHLKILKIMPSMLHCWNKYLVAQNIWILSKPNCIYLLKCRLSCQKRPQRCILFSLGVTTAFKKLILFNFSKFCIFNVNFSLESELDFRQNLQIRSAAQTVYSSYVTAAGILIWTDTVLNAEFKNAWSNTSTPQRIIMRSSLCNRP